MTDQEDRGGGPPAIPPAAHHVFGDRLSQAEAFATVLADTGVSHGLIGPREVPRLWDRHILNCAVIHDAFPEGATVIDVGSGAGLPGVAVAIARPDLRIHMVEPSLRRTAWLSRVVADLELANCTIHRGRAEEFHGRLRAPFVTARAVARIDKLARWTFPLLGSEGTLVAMKGRGAIEELEAERVVLTQLGMVGAVFSEHGVGVLEEPTLTLDLSVRRGGQAALASRRRATHTHPRRSRNAR
ncbi:MAG TPA: 16S rRNA (guanine(527)-N(7))-methyltransferase RsmG [Dermatophilaceae bacterium]|nr:16S rRNA (guanine(527)-N(7))-methyltransferase RsmG [Dermatophilaceae bacterium]